MPYNPGIEQKVEPPTPEPFPCYYCYGDGYITNTNDPVVNLGSPCFYCSGTGSPDIDKCPNCHGHGAILDTEDFTLHEYELKECPDCKGRGDTYEDFQKHIEKFLNQDYYV